jgi:hypothetical protein
MKMMATRPLPSDELQLRVRRKMQGEPIQIRSVAASRAKRSASGFAQPIHRARNTASDLKSTSVLDEAFADFMRIDAGSQSIVANNKSVAQNWPSKTQALISDIATQLETLDSQRRRLAQLLEGVDTSAIV